MTPVIEAEVSQKLERPALEKGDPCTLVIFGASGDLSRRKLIPALYDLCGVGCMHACFEVVGIGRTHMTDEQFRESMREAAKSSKDVRGFNEEKWQKFAKRLRYVVGDPAEKGFYAELRSYLEKMQENGSSPNTLFYVSTPASFAGEIVSGLQSAGLNNLEKGWSRIILEKPFGRDLESARVLNETVLKVFDEKNVYRIDHYLGKETVQNILVFRSIRPMTLDEVAANTLRGQYGPGHIGNEAVPGYRQEPGVKPNSTTETYAAIRLQIDNWRWAGVPFYLRTGKRLANNVTEIKVHFKPTPQALIAEADKGSLGANVVSLRLQPDEGISVSFGAKRPGTHMSTVPVKARFTYADAFGGNTPVAYETLILDAMRGDATLFTRRDEVEAEWKIITPIEEAWAQLPAPTFPNYAAGSEGPAEANKLLEAAGHRWMSMLKKTKELADAA